MLTASDRTLLPSTQDLLTAGGDERLWCEAQSGRSPYGWRAFPETDLIALGSCTASGISVAGFAAATALRAQCSAQLRHATEAQVYAHHCALLRTALAEQCGFADPDRIGVVLAASGTDLHLLVGQWLRPDRIVTIAASDTGSGVPSALQGRHFRRCTAYGGHHPTEQAFVGWQSRLDTVQARNPDGSVRPASAVDAECEALVDAAVAAGQSVLLIVTDVSKTGLIVPSHSLARVLKKRWPAQVDVMVDACQFRLTPGTVRSYLADDFIVALTGSKFLAGPTFCAALMVPPAIALRYRQRPFAAALAAYSCAADWPPDWPCGQSLPPGSNFGLLLRWHAALPVAKQFAALDGAAIRLFLQHLGTVVRGEFARQRCFEEVPVAALDRATPNDAAGWDAEQTIFPFLLKKPDADGAMQLLDAAQVDALHRHLQQPFEQSGKRFYLGQPVTCGDRDGQPLIALRLCVSAPMIVAACGDGQARDVIDDVLAALHAVRSMLDGVGGSDRR